MRIEAFHQFHVAAPRRLLGFREEMHGKLSIGGKVEEVRLRLRLAADGQTLSGHISSTHFGNARPLVGHIATTQKNAIAIQLSLDFKDARFQRHHLALTGVFSHHSHPLALDAKLVRSSDSAELGAGTIKLSPQHVDALYVAMPSLRPPKPKAKPAAVAEQLFSTTYKKNEI